MGHVRLDDYLLDPQRLSVPAGEVRLTVANRGRIGHTLRLRKAFAPADFDQLFRLDTQLGLFDMPVAEIEPIWIRATEN